MPGNVTEDQQSLADKHKLCLLISMPAPLPPLAAVRAFEAAARLLNFTEAAAELGMTQAAVSYQIKLLEERLGTPLFHRTGRRVELTAQGQALAPTIIRAFDEMRSGFDSLKQDHASILTISCTNSFAHLWLAPRIGGFQMHQPDLAVRIQATDDIVDFARDHVDIAIRGGSGEWQGLEARLLTNNRVVPLCSPDFLRRVGPIGSAAQLLKVARLSPEDHWWHEWFGAMGVRLETSDAPPAIALDSQVMEGRAAMAGQGVAIVNAFLWKSEIEAGLLVEATPSYVVEAARYWIVYAPANRNLPKIKAFRDWIAAEFAIEKARDPDGRFLPRG